MESKRAHFIAISAGATSRLGAEMETLLEQTPRPSVGNNTMPPRDPDDDYDDDEAEEDEEDEDQHEEPPVIREPDE